MAFQGEGSKKNVLRKGLDRLGRINYFSQNRESTPMTQAEAQPLRGAVAELAAVAEAMSYEAQQQANTLAEKQRQDLEKRINHITEAAENLKQPIVETLNEKFRLPAEVELDPNSFSVDTDFERERYEDVTMHIFFKGKARLGSSDDKIELDVVHEESALHNSNRVMHKNTLFYYKGNLVRNALALHRVISDEE
jgi:hypothetical protein